MKDIRNKAFFSKAGQLAHWSKMKPKSNILGTVKPISNAHTGSTYGACGIRICGNPEFVDAVMARLTDLIDAENAITRLAVTRSVVTSPTINGQKKEFHDGEDCVYIQVFERGNEAIGTEYRKGATDRWLDANPKRREAHEKAVALWNMMLGKKAA